VKQRNARAPGPGRRPSARIGRALLLCAAVVPAACGADQSSSAVMSTSSAPAPPATTIAAPISTPLDAVPSVDPYADVPLIDHTTWTEGVDGARLLVFPTQAGRHETFPNTEERAWQEVLAQTADADTPGMRDQFVCHWIWARMVQPNKESWNLEPWRPAVGYQATVQASCNPGGPER
jgi:hypothetical protein